MAAARPERVLQLVLQTIPAGEAAGPSHSDVPSQVHGARFPVSTRTHREVLALMDRAEEKAGPEDVGEQALMRGLDTAYPCFRLGLSLV